MVSKSRLFSKILGEGTTGTIPVESLSTSVPLGVEDYSSVINLPLSGNNIGDQAFVSSTGRLYIWTGVGWYNIALVNTTPIWDSNGEPASTYMLATDGTATTITLLASDPEGLVISYTATTDSDLDAIASISQNNNQFTITPLFTTDDDSAQSGSGTITFRATDGVNILPAISTFNINFSLALENSRYTSALITTKGTAGQNNVIVDSSSNNYTVTNTSNYAQVTSFSPYRSGGYSWYFDGSGDNIAVPSGQIVIGTNDFTYEAWIYPTGNPGWGSIISPNYGANGIGFFWHSPGNLVAYGNGNLLSWADILQQNVWQHVALTRENGVLYLYHNGIKYGSSAANTYDLTDTLYKVGSNSSGGEVFIGYIRDARIVNGTAVYTSNYTVPTEPLENIANTALLTCHLPYLKDGSSNNLALTANGDVYPRPFSPFDYTPYDETLSSGSIYLDGSSQYIPVPGTYNYGSSAFTLEGWIYPQDNSAAFLPVDLRDLNTNWPNGIYLYFNPSGFSVTADVSESAPLDITTPNNIWGYNRWNHFALVRENTDTNGARFYINGTLAATGTMPATVDVNSITLGGDTSGGGRMKGYISDIRFTIGTALYSSNFTPPIEQVPSSGANLHITGGKTSHIIDKSQSTGVLLRNTFGYGASVSGTSGASQTVTKYAGSSIKIDGANNNYYVLSPRLITSQDFTIEAWVYPTQTSTKYLLGNVNAAGTYEIGMIFELSSASLTGYFGKGSGAGYTNHSFSTTINANQWHHIAIEKTVEDYGTGANRINLYVNGVANEGPSISYVELGALPWVIGAYGEGAGSTFFQGYIEDLRFSNVSRYKGQNFTPPTTSLEV